MVDSYSTQRLKTPPVGRADASPTRGNTGKANTASEVEEIRNRLTFLYEISKKVRSSQRLSQLLGQVTKMAQHSLNAAASSVLLLDNKNGELVFEVAGGPAGDKLNQVKISAQSGIAGWVATHGEPLIINDASQDSRFDKDVDKVTGFETKSVICTPLIVSDRIIGVIEVLNKMDGGTFDTHDLEIMMSVASTVALTIDSAKTRQGMLDSYKSTMLVLAAAIETRDPYARGHAQRVAEYVFLQANSLALSREEKEAIEYAAILHDIGKAYIPDKILLKPGPFTLEEWKIMHKHPAIGANMLKQIPLLVETSKLVLYHHERYDGSGYPSALKGEAIPLGARLIAVADAFDTMTTTHLYRASFYSM